MTMKMWKRALCIGLTCWMLAITAHVPQPQEPAYQDADVYEVIAPSVIYEPDGGDD